MNEIVQRIVVSVDVVVFTIIQNKLNVLLLKRSSPPFAGMRCLPGGLVNEKQSCEDSAHMMIYNKTGIKRLYLEQLKTFSSLDRDPRGRTVSVSYMCIGKEFDITQFGAHGEVGFLPIKTLPNLGFDHLEIVKYAYQRLKNKLEYTNVVQYFLPKQFTLSQLQKVYEIIMGYNIDVRNFRKKIKQLSLLKETGKKQQNVGFRPAMLYEFLHKDIVNV